MANLITYRLQRVTRFISGVELQSGQVLTDYLNTDLTEFEEKYHMLRSIFVHLDLGETFFQIPQKEIPSTIRQINQLTGYIDQFCLSRLPYTILSEDAGSKPGFSRLSDLPFLDESATIGFRLQTQLQKTSAYYLSLCEGILRTKYFIAPFIKDYYYRYGIPKNAHDTARPYIEYTDHLNELNRISPLEPYYFDYRVSYTDSHAIILKQDSSDGSTNRRIWQQLEYQHVGDFLYAEFSDLVRGRISIKKCLNCGRFFLMNAHYNTDYCSQPSPEDPTKTCREIGAQVSYKNRVQNDPILKAYQRSYKTHYARINKGKMTKKDFLQWCDKAIELRNKAQEGSISFDEYLKSLND